MSTLFLQLYFFRGKFLQTDGVSLLLQIERGDFIARAGQILSGGKRIGLGLPQ